MSTKNELSCSEAASIVINAKKAQESKPPVGDALNRELFIWVGCFFIAYMFVKLGSGDAAQHWQMILGFIVALRIIYTLAIWTFAIGILFLAAFGRWIVIGFFIALGFALFHLI